VSIRVVTDVSGSRLAGQLMRALVRILAGILIALSCAGSISLVLIIPAAIPWFRKYTNWLPTAVVTHLGYAVLAGLAALACVAVARPLSRLNRREVLYLRRFGDPDTAHAVTDALQALGGSWRLIALDDRTLKPVSTKLSSRWTTSLMLLFIAFQEAAGRLFGLAKITGFPTLALLVFLALRAEGTLSQRWHGALRGSGFLHVAGRSGFEITVIALVATIIFFVLRWTTVPVFATILGLGTSDDAEQSAREFIRIQDDIFLAQKTLRENAKRAIAARIAVIKVADTLWRESVARLADDAAVVLVDVSEPTKHVVWEVEYLLAADIPCVFIGAAPRLAYLTDHSHVSNYGVILRERLDGRTVVSYVTGDPKSARQAFARTLRVSFERLGKRHLPRSDSVYRAQQHMRSRRPDRAVAIFERVAHRRQQLLSPDHEVTLCALHDLAVAYQAAKRRDEACALFERILWARERQPHGEEVNAARLAAREDLASAYDAAGRIADSRPLRAQNVDDARELLGSKRQARKPDDPSTQRAARDLASVCLAAGLYAEAIPLLKSNLEAFLRHNENGQSALEILLVRDDLVRAYAMSGQRAEALRLHQQNQSESARVLGRNERLRHQLYRARVQAWQATKTAGKAK
jgi:hypothetical protein